MMIYSKNNNNHHHHHHHHRRDSACVLHWYVAGDGAENIKIRQVFHGLVVFPIAELLIPGGQNDPLNGWPCRIRDRRESVQAQ